jgi:hypothetical protein
MHGAGAGRRGLGSAAAAGPEDSHDEGAGDEDLVDGGMSLALSAGEQAKLDREATKFAASWATELSAAAWEDMGEKAVGAPVTHPYLPARAPLAALRVSASKNLPNHGASSRSDVSLPWCFLSR